MEYIQDLCVRTMILACIGAIVSGIYLVVDTIFDLEFELLKKLAWLLLAISGILLAIVPIIGAMTAPEGVK